MDAGSILALGTTALSVCHRDPRFIEKYAKLDSPLHARLAEAVEGRRNMNWEALGAIADSLVPPESSIPVPKSPGIGCGRRRWDG